MLPLKKMTKVNPTKRGGLREPKGGRPPKPLEEKYQQYPLKLPPDLIEWLEANVENKNGFIVVAIRTAITLLGMK